MKWVTFSGGLKAVLLFWWTSYHQAVCCGERVRVTTTATSLPLTSHGHPPHEVTRAFLKNSVSRIGFVQRSLIKRDSRFQLWRTYGWASRKLLTKDATATVKCCFLFVCFSAEGESPITCRMAKAIICKLGHVFLQLHNLPSFSESEL